MDCPTVLSHTSGAMREMWNDKAALRKHFTPHGPRVTLATGNGKVAFQWASSQPLESLLL
jgi:hypothetical protein